LVPALAHERLASMPHIVLARLSGEIRGREISLYWRDASPWPTDLQAFAELLRRLARQRPGLRVRRSRTESSARR
jgi:LysR family hydrogen peroxide-inducible transcriptional activator